MPNVNPDRANAKTTWDSGKRMRAFDNFPPEVRRALADASGDWSIQQCHTMLHGGDKSRGINAHSPASLVALIRFNDAKRA